MHPMTREFLTHRRHILPAKLPMDHSRDTAWIPGRAARLLSVTLGTIKRFAQPQGTRRHHHEKHEPRQCPHCHVVRWGRLYLFQSTSRQSILRSNPRQPHRTRLGGTNKEVPSPPGIGSSLVFPFPSPDVAVSMMPSAQQRCFLLRKTLDTKDGGARTGALRPLQRMESSKLWVYYGE
ncbi:hypothetical protein EDB86DRAFT_1070504 [Lactarius hatsudake]|nr:hypothetical protein EDB86DRAFT_1070504 [Lactarius hatsudake]